MFRMLPSRWVIYDLWPTIDIRVVRLYLFYYSRTVWALLTILSVISLNFLQASRTLNNSEC
jgi:hypothetical protein